MRRELAGTRAEVVDILLHAVADIDEGIDTLPAALSRTGVRQHLADLGVAAMAGDRVISRASASGSRDPSRRAAFTEATEIDQLHVEAADLAFTASNMSRLKRERHVPGRLPAHGRVHGEDQPPAARGRLGVIDFTRARKASSSAPLEDRSGLDRATLSVFTGVFD